MNIENLFGELWKQTLGDERIRIAVLDGPVNLKHPAFEGSKLRFISGERAASIECTGQASQHGTHVTSIIFGQHRSPIKGIAPKCSGVLVPIFPDSPESGSVNCSQIDLARAIQLAIDHGANLINISGGEFVQSGTAHPILGDLLDRCEQEGVLVIAAAGNDGCDCLHIPAAHSSILAVGAADFDGTPLGSSNWGELYQKNGILAVGSNVLGANPCGGVTMRSGTSFATAVVTGTAALLMSLQLSRGDVPNGSKLRKLLLDSATRCDKETRSECKRYLSGLLNINKATTFISRNSMQMSQNHPDEQQFETSAPNQTSTVSNMQQVSASQQDCANTQYEMAKFQIDSAVSSTVQPSSCSCTGGDPRRLVYALGKLGYDFGSEVRRDSIQQKMQGRGFGDNPEDAEQFDAYLEQEPWDTAAVNWVLRLDATPIYAIRPAGPYATEAYRLLRRFLKEQRTEGIERISIPGVLSGQVRLLTGQILPVIEPDLRGAYSWTTSALIDSVCGKASENQEIKGEQDQKRQCVRNFLDRVYYEVRNLGLASQDRAINYAATNAFEIERVYEEAIRDEMDLDSIGVERSPISRPGSDSWDVLLRFFFPQRQVQTVRKVYRFTVDVSDTVPVTVGEVRSWFVR